MSLLQNPPPQGGVGLFCQAITGADGLQGTNRGTKNQKKKENGVFGISASPGVRKVVVCPLFGGGKLRTIFAKKRPNSRPLTEELPFQPRRNSGYCTCAQAAGSTEAGKKMGSSAAYKTRGPFLSQKMGHEASSAPPPCDMPSRCCSFTGPWTVTRSSLRMLRRVAAFCRPLRPVLLLVSFPRSRSPVVGVLGGCAGCGGMCRLRVSGAPLPLPPGSGGFIRPPPFGANFHQPSAPPPPPHRAKGGPPCPPPPSVRAAGVGGHRRTWPKALSAGAGRCQNALPPRPARPTGSARGGTPGATTTGPDATPPPPLSVKTCGGGGESAGWWGYWQLGLGGCDLIKKQTNALAWGGGGGCAQPTTITWEYRGMYAIIAISRLCQEESLKGLKDQRHSTPLN